MKKNLPYLLAILSLIGMLFWGGKYTYAVPGQLNNQLIQQEQQPPEQVVVKDTKEIDECNLKKSEVSTQLTNCQQANALFSGTQEELKKQKTMFMQLSMISGGLALCLGITSLILAFKIKKMKSAPPA